MGTRCAGGRAGLGDTKCSVGFHLQRPNKAEAATHYLQSRLAKPQPARNQRLEQLFETFEILFVACGLPSCLRTIDFQCIGYTRNFLGGYYSQWVVIKG